MRLLLSASSFQFTEHSCHQTNHITDLPRLVILDRSSTVCTIVDIDHMHDLPKHYPHHEYLQRRPHWTMSRVLRVPTSEHQRVALSIVHCLVPVPVDGGHSTTRRHIVAHLLRSASLQATLSCLP
jgi:hypothetical protein